VRQVAVFVDAGYLYAQGSALLEGQKQPRNHIRLDIEATLAALKSLSEVTAPDARLLRTYWYDGIGRGGRLTSEQERVGGAQYTKLRLGLVNSKGEQKGVDSLLVTDLIDLARNRAITDALLLTGDEDIRVGVQIAQTFGVQIHLLGIKPARGSQSPDLIQESDTHHEWTDDIVRSLMQIEKKDAELAAAAQSPKSAKGACSGDGVEIDEIIKSAVGETLDSMDATALASAVSAFKVNPMVVPQELDRPTLGRLGKTLGRNLTDDERKQYRNHFKAILKDL
jgi:uncharacterized LabA/DUF88 family protein